MRIKKKRFLKIAKIKEGKDEFLEFEVKLNKYDNCNEGNVVDVYDNIPLSTYYYETVALLYGDPENVIEEFKYEVCRLYYFCEECLCFDDEFCDTHFNTISESITKFSILLKNYLLGKTKHIKNFSIFDKLCELFTENYSKKYNVWIERCKDLTDAVSSVQNTVVLAYPIKSEKRNSETSFFSLCGAKNDYVGYGDFGTYALEKEYDAVSELIESIFGFKFTRCHLVGETLRFTKFSTIKELNTLDYNGAVTHFPVPFVKDYMENKNVAGFARHYCCCERKILAEMGLDHSDYNKIVYTRTVYNKLTDFTFRMLHEPCRMCKPALIGCFSLVFDDCKTNYTIYHVKNSMRDPLDFEENVYLPWRPRKTFGYERVF